MAQRVQVILEDDLDGGSADETVTFALDGVAYEIDLKSDNAEKLRSLLAPYVDKGRKQSGRSPARAAPAAAARPVRPPAVRTRPRSARGRRTTATT